MTGADWRPFSLLEQFDNQRSCIAELITTVKNAQSLQRPPPAITRSMSPGLRRTDLPIQIPRIVPEAIRRLTVRSDTLRIAAASATVRSGPTWRPPKIEAKDLLISDREQQTPSRCELVRMASVVARLVGCAAEAALARAQAGILSDRYFGLVFSTKGSESWSPASRARSRDGQGASSTGP